MSEYHKRKAKHYREKAYAIANRKSYMLGFIPLPKHPEEWAIAHYYLLCAKDHERKLRAKQKKRRA